MKFNSHFELVGQHAFLSASKYHWLNYDEEKVVSSYSKFLAAQRGTELHEFAARCIELNIKLAKSKRSLNCYVNDAIGFRMKAEQPLFYSLNSYGTADAISFRDNILRIHDLKTGVSPVSMHQLEIYSALFCLEYVQKPERLDIQLRLYQSDEIQELSPDPKDIREIMGKIVSFDKLLEKTKSELED
jgi:hypothetical protein